MSTIPPNVLEAERVVLGAGMLDAKHVEACADVLRAEHFAGDLHRRAWVALCAIVERGDDPSPLAVKHELEAGRIALPPAAVADLASMGDGLPRMSDVGHWARIVRDAARRRAVVTIATKLVEAASAHDEDTDEILSRHQLAIERLIKASETSHTHPIERAVKEALEDVDRIMTAPSDVTGVPTGIPDFDNLTGGLQPGELIVIAARPRRGKSVFCTQTAAWAAGKGHRVLLFSLEMAPRQVAKRMMFADAEVDRYQLRSSKAAYDRLVASAGRISELPITTDDRDQPNLGQIRAAAKRLAACGGIDLLIVDYLQRCAVDRKLERHLAIGELVDGLKSLAMSLSIPVLTACQVGREGESSKPTLAMLRESGSIEQTADIVGILHPQDMHGKSPDEVMALEFPQVNLWVEKHRNGAEMMIPLSFEKRHMRFVNLSRKTDAE